MKRVKIDSLMHLTPDEISYQKEWTANSQQGKRSLLLEVALFAGNIGPGLFMISYFTDFEMGLLAGFLIVLLGYGLPHLVFLGKVGRFWRAVLNPRGSWISKGFLFASVFMLAGGLAIFHLVPFVGFELFSTTSDVYMAIMWVAMGSCFLLTIYPGFLFSVLKAIPFWNSGALVPLFLVQALGAGFALTFMMYAPAFFNSAVENWMIYADIALLASTGIFISLLLVGKKGSGKARRKSVATLLSGKYRRMFMSGAVGCGIVLPVVMLAISVAGFEFPYLLAVAGLLQVIGIMLFKYSFLNAGAYDSVYTKKTLAEPRTNLR